MILDQILAVTKERLQLRMSITSRSEMEKRARAAGPPKDFLGAVRRPHGSPIRIIAELRRVTPFRGVLRPDLDAEHFSTSCAEGGAAALSVCTEENQFGGSPQDMNAVRAAVDLPLLRQDFILDQYQIFESRALGADAVVLSTFLLDRGRLRDLLTCLRDLGMIGVVEISEERELGTAIATGAQCLRIDNRDPRTLRPVSGKAEQLRMLIPSDLQLIVEGERGNSSEIAHWNQEGVDALLLSEALILCNDPKSKIQELLGGRT